MAGSWRCYFRNGFGDLKDISFGDEITLNLRIDMHDRCTWETVPVETVVWTSNYLYIGTVLSFSTLVQELDSWKSTPRKSRGMCFQSWCGLPNNAEKERG